MQTRPRIVVLGIGNTLLADEGVGVQALARMRVNDPGQGLIFVDGGTLGPALLECVAGVDGLIIIDAARLDLAPGSVSRYCDSAIDDLLRSRIRTVHELGLKDLFDMARVSGTLPPRRQLIAVEPARVDWGTDLSPVVEAALDRVGAMVRETAALWKAAWAVSV